MISKVSLSKDSLESPVAYVHYTEISLCPTSHSVTNKISEVHSTVFLTQKKNIFSLFSKVPKIHFMNISPLLVAGLYSVQKKCWQ